jgi:hypothetical protein
MLIRPTGSGQHPAGIDVKIWRSAFAAEPHIVVGAFQQTGLSLF